MNMPKMGEVIAGRYQVESKLGEGGMGVVFGVRHIGIDRRYAMKVLSPRLSLDQDYRTRFIREAKITARLTHRHVVQVYDSGMHDGLLYIVMEFLNGTPLSEMLWGKKVGELVDVLRIGRQVSEALEAAHEIGLVHRDLKTDNILVEENEESGERRCVLLDFGLAYISESDDLGRLTRESDTNVAGTPLYMSPEQISASSLTAATDVYSLGCVIYELLVGKTPFEGGNPTIIKVMTRHLFKAPEPIRRKLPSIPIAVEELVMSMLTKDPALRPTAIQAAKAFADLEHLPAAGRGGIIRSREERQLQEPTARGDARQDTLRFQPGAKQEHGHKVVGLWGLGMSEDNELALASSGFIIQELESIEDLERIDLLLTGPLPLEDIKTLASRSNIVLFVAPAMVGQAADLLRAGVLDVIPHDAAINELIQRLERVYKRVSRLRKRKQKKEKNDV